MLYEKHRMMTLAGSREFLRYVYSCNQHFSTIPECHGVSDVRTDGIAKSISRRVSVTVNSCGPAIKLIHKEPARLCFVHMTLRDMILKSFLLFCYGSSSVNSNGSRPSTRKDRANTAHLSLCPEVNSIRGRYEPEALNDDKS